MAFSRKSCLDVAGSIFPARIKYAKGIVISKEGDRNRMANFRAISILPEFAKALKKGMLRKIDRLFFEHSLLSGSQFGFRKGKSTALALLLQKENILNNIEANNLTLGIFVDFTKGFDFLIKKYYSVNWSAIVSVVFLLSFFGLI